MSVRSILVVLVAVLGIADAADPVPAPPVPAAPATSTAPVPPPPPAQLDAVAVRRAEQAADDYLAARAAANTPVDPQAEHALAEAEVGLLEAQAYLDQRQPLKAGDQYLLATGKLAAIPPEQRAVLDQRYRKANAALTALSKRLLNEQAFDLGAAAPESKATDHGAH